MYGFLHTQVASGFALIAVDTWRQAPLPQSLSEEHKDFLTAMAMGDKTSGVEELAADMLLEKEGLVIINNNNMVEVVMNMMLFVTNIILTDTDCTCKGRVH